MFSEVSGGGNGVLKFKRKWKETENHWQVAN